MNVKETLELFKALEAEADVVVAACADGKLGLGDLKAQLLALKVLKEGFAGANLVAAELKDLDGDELEVLINTLVTVGGKLVAAFVALTAVFSK